MIKGEIPRKLLLAAADAKDYEGLLFKEDTADGSSPFEEWYRKQNKYGRYRIRKAFQNLQEQGLIDMHKDMNGETRVSLTDTGRQAAMKYRLDSLRLIPLPQWDGRWRMVLIGDVEIKHKNNLRMRLKKLGLKRIQKGIWVYPHDCAEEVKFISEAMGVYPKIRFAEVIFAEDRDLKKFFGLI